MKLIRTASWALALAAASGMALAAPTPFQGPPGHGGPAGAPGRPAPPQDHHWHGDPGHDDHDRHDWHGDRDHHDWHGDRDHHDWHGGRDHHDWHDAHWHGPPPPPRWGPPPGGWRHDWGRHPDWVRGRRYYGPRYVVSDYGYYRLRPPPRGYHWVRAENDNFLLVAIATGVILDIATQ